MKVTASTSISNVTTPEDVARFTSIALAQIVLALNGKLSSLDNLILRVLTFEFAGANMEVGLSHGLGVVPTGYYIVGCAASPPQIYDGVTANDDTKIYLRSTAAGTVRVAVFQ